MSEETAAPALEEQNATVVLLDELDVLDDPDNDAADPIALDPFGRAVVPDYIASAEPEDLTAVLEAVCFALNRPVSTADVASILGISVARVAATVELLAQQLQQRGLMLQRHDDVFQLVTRPQAAWAVQRALNPEKPGRLSKAATETLAIVAYRQPATVASIEAIRGVSCEAVLESLERRGLIAEVGRQDSPGHPRLFGTTLRFLQIVGLERIEDLPPLPEGMYMPDVDDDRWNALADDSETQEAGAEQAS